MSIFTQREECGIEIECVRMRIYYPEKCEKWRGVYNMELNDWTRQQIDRPRILEGMRHEYEKKIGSYRCSAEQTFSGQDMSSYRRERDILFSGYKQVALVDMRKECIRLITNCKTVLTDSRYDMFEEFKNAYPSMAEYFNLKELDITWDIAMDIVDNMILFIERTIKCVLSQEATLKRIKWKPGKKI